MRILGLGIIAAVALALTAPVVIAVHAAQDPGRVVACTSNLRELWRIQHIYMNRYGGRLKSMPV